jgi:hypothetical protein
MQLVRYTSASYRANVGCDAAPTPSNAALFARRVGTAKLHDRAKDEREPIALSRQTPASAKGG